MLRIAIVEDHESDAKRLTALLEAYAQKNGKRFAITWIANANTFLDSYQHQYELVFMDIRMPGLNGMMAAHELREMDHTVVLVFLTSLAQYAVESYEVEATDYNPEAHYRRGAGLEASAHPEPLHGRIGRGSRHPKRRHNDAPAPE